MYIQAIQKFEELDRKLRKLNYGDHNIFQGIKKETLMLLGNFLPDNEEFRTDIKAIKVKAVKGESPSLDQWIKGHEELINLFQIIIQDLKIKQHKAVLKSGKKDEIEKYISEIDRIKNDTGKDLIMERNNYNYLKRRYDLLQYNYDQLNSAYHQVLGKKTDWISYVVMTVTVGIIIMIFNLFISWSWFDSHQQQHYLKIIAFVFFAIILLLIPFKKNIRLILLAGIVLVVGLLVALLPFG